MKGTNKNEVRRKLKDIEGTTKQIGQDGKKWKSRRMEGTKKQRDN
jgi:hypothetical protein